MGMERRSRVDTQKLILEDRKNSTEEIEEPRSPLLPLKNKFKLVHAPPVIHPHRKNNTASPHTNEEVQKVNVQNNSISEAN